MTRSYASTFCVTMCEPMMSGTRAAISWVGFSLAIVLIVAPGARMQAQAAGDQTVARETAAGPISATLRMPASPAAPPVVLLVSSSDTAPLAAALADKGVASIRLPSGNPDTLAMADWLSWLRNDGRFPITVVFGEGAMLPAAVVAARAARADGVVTRGDATAARAELARLLAKHLDLAAGSATDDAARIQAFVAGVPTLGRRGAPQAARPQTPRRSPRHVLMAAVGNVHLAIEWGQPQARGREVWGALVKWDEIWMPGADEATVLTTDGAIAIGSIEVPAGDHTLYTWPTAQLVQLLISRDVGQFHTVHDMDLIIGRVDLAASDAPAPVEGMTFGIEPNGAGATLSLSWDKRKYSASITVR